MEKTTRLLADAKTALAKVADADKNALYLALVATVNAVESMTADPATAIPPAVADADAKAKADADAKAKADADAKAKADADAKAAEAP